MPKKTIVFVSDAIYPYNKGGKETRLHEISTRLARKGYDVHIYCMKWWNTPETVRVEEGVTLHAISPLYLLYSGERRSIKQGILFGLACLKLFKEKFDVIDVDHMPYFPLYAVRLVCWLKGKKMHATWHEVWGFPYWVEYMGLSGYVAGLIEYLAMKLPDTFISVSDHTTEQLQKFVPKEKIVTIPNGVDIEEIKKAKPSKIKSDVIYAGRLLKHKNVDVLINAIKLVTKTKPTIRCLIVGNGPEETKLKEQTKALNLEKNISFIGFCKTNAELYGLMKSSRVFMLPSTREGFGLTILEANACGLPFITSNSPYNAANRFTDLNGVISKVTPDKLANNIMFLLRHRQFTKKNRSDLERYSWLTLSEKYITKILNRNLRIIQTPVRFFPAVGGVENHVYYLSKQLVTIGNKVTVICANRPESKETLIDGVIVNRLNSPIKITNTDITPTLPFQLLSTSFDIVHTHMPTPWTADISVLVAKIMHKKSVITIHNDIDKPDKFGRLITRIYLSSVFRFTLSIVDKIIIVNPEWKQTFKETRNLLKNYENKIITIPNGVDTELFSPKISNHHTDVNLLFVSVLDEYHEFKGLNYLISSIETLIKNNVPIKLTIVGEGILRNRYEHEVNQKKLNKYISFVGAKTQKELVTYYRQSDIFVLPSVDIEGFGIVLLEAMACGIPVISTNIAGVSKVVQQYDCGIIIQPRDTHALTSAINKLVSHSDIREHYGRNAALTARRMYSWSTIADTINRLYRELI